MPDSADTCPANGPLGLDAAADLTRTGDLWLFRGRSTADQAIRALTNSPVNHVGMSVVLDDLPPLMWHAELGKGLMDVWTNSHHRGVQLHDLREAEARPGSAAPAKEIIITNKSTSRFIGCIVSIRLCKIKLLMLYSNHEETVVWSHIGAFCVLLSLVGICARQCGYY